MAFTNGDRVKIISRETTSADSKSGLYYDYFRNLTGTVEHVYEDNSASISIDFDSLPEDVQLRHLETTEAVRQRWLKGLSGEQRDRMSDKEKAVSLKYNILVSLSDLEPGPKAKASSKTPKVSAERKTEDELEKAETEYLESLSKESE